MYFLMKSVIDYISNYEFLLTNTAFKIFTAGQTDKILLYDRNRFKIMHSFQQV